jgi:hypothetical protein
METDSLSIEIKADTLELRMKLREKDEQEEIPQT